MTEEPMKGDLEFHPEDPTLRLCKTTLMDDWRWLLDERSEARLMEAARACGYRLKEAFGLSRWLWVDEAWVDVSGAERFRCVGTIANTRFTYCYGTHDHEAYQKMRAAVEAAKAAEAEAQRAEDGLKAPRQEVQALAPASSRSLPRPTTAPLDRALIDDLTIRHHLKQGVAVVFALPLCFVVALATAPVDLAAGWLRGSRTQKEKTR